MIYIFFNMSQCTETQTRKTDRQTDSPTDRQKSSKNDGNIWYSCAKQNQWPL